MGVLKPFFSWLWPLGGMRVIEGNAAQQHAAYEHNRRHRHLALQALERWSLVTIVCFLTGAVLEEAKMPVVLVAPWFVLFAAGVAAVFFAVVVYVFLGRKS